jgi:prepilin-type N-terminal cleavage/methylation domain-containing protein
MNTYYWYNRKVYNGGFTLVEVLVVIVIMTVIASIAVPFFLGTMEKVREEVCNENKLRVERSYELHLILEDLVHSYVLFIHHLQLYNKEICPENGVMSYEDGEVNCSVHLNDDAEDDGDVPFL